jgi:hypothetical protein
METTIEEEILLASIVEKVQVITVPNIARNNWHDVVNVGITDILIAFVTQLMEDGITIIRLLKEIITITIMDASNNGLPQIITVTDHLLKQAEDLPYHLEDQISMHV